jgi:hypothetical protein
VWAFAILATLAMALSGAADLYHQATTRHTRCAEHGELVHRNGEGDRDARVARHEHAAPRDGTLRDRPAGGPVDPHEHCPFPCAAPTSVIAARRVTALTAPRQPALAALRRAPPPLVGRHLYRSAPKTSPPA